MSIAGTLAIGSALGTRVGRAETAEDLVQEIRSAIGPGPVDLALLLASPHFEDELEQIAAGVQERLAARAFVGATGETVVHGAYELENQPGIVLWAARLPDTNVRSFHLSQEDFDRLGSAGALCEHLGVPADAAPYFILLADPYSYDTDQLLRSLAESYPGRPALGGMASAAERPGQNVLLFDGEPMRHGMVGVALWGAVAIDFVVSQGCRPIGRHMVITRAERNIIYQLGGKPALNAANEVLKELAPQDMELLRKRGLLVGRVINEYQQTFSRGDFLIRNPIGIDQKNGAMHVNDLIRTGQTVQFHVRDANTAAEDLAALLGAATRAQHAGALLFTCNGRGTRLFDHKHHDARALASACGALPTAGFFAAGEIGPIGDRNFLHGHTASIGLFRATADDGADAADGGPGRAGA